MGRACCILFSGDLRRPITSLAKWDYRAASVNLLLWSLCRLWRACMTRVPASSWTEALCCDSPAPPALQVLQGNLVASNHTIASRDLQEGALTS